MFAGAVLPKLSRSVTRITPYLPWIFYPLILFNDVHEITLIQCNRTFKEVYDTIISLLLNYKIPRRSFLSDESRRRFMGCWEPFSSSSLFGALEMVESPRIGVGCALRLSDCVFVAILRLPGLTLARCAKFCSRRLTSCGHDIGSFWHTSALKYKCCKTQLQDNARVTYRPWMIRATPQ